MHICVHVRPCVRDKQNEDPSIELLSCVTRGQNLHREPFKADHGFAGLRAKGAPQL